MDLLGLNLLIFFINYKVSDMYTLVDSTFKLYVTSHVIFYQMARLNHWERLSKRGRVPEGDRLICSLSMLAPFFALLKIFWKKPRICSTGLETGCKPVLLL